MYSHTFFQHFVLICSVWWCFDVAVWKIIELLSSVLTVDQTHNIVVRSIGVIYFVLIFHDGQPHNSGSSMSSQAAMIAQKSRPNDGQRSCILEWGREGARFSGNTFCEVQRTSESGSPADTSEASWSAPWKKASLSTASRHKTGQAHVQQCRSLRWKFKPNKVFSPLECEIAWTYWISRRCCICLFIHPCRIKPLMPPLCCCLSSLPCPAITGREQHVPGVSDWKQLGVLHHVAHGGTGTRWHQNEGGHASRLRAHPQLQLFCKFLPDDSSWLLTTSIPLLIHFHQRTASEGYASENNWKSKGPPTELSLKKLPNHCKQIAFANRYKEKSAIFFC